MEREGEYEVSCFFGHKWSKWEQFSENHNLITKDGKLSPKYIVKKQKRHCLICNRVEIERIDE